MVKHIPKRIIYKYGDHDLQTLSVWHPVTEPSGDDEGKYWIIYFHGGAWRDACITNESFLPTLNSLYSNHPSTISHIAGFASLDYRLSPHPDLPQDRASTPSNSFRDAKHPDHIHDVLAALSLLQKAYGFGERYVLVGHSCGATLAFQTIMGLEGVPRDEGSAAVKVPAAIVGIAGIYDLRLLRDNHTHPAYQSFLSGAFGEDEALWDEVSPASSRAYGSDWRQGKVVVLAHSADDELVEEAQIEMMMKTLEDSKGTLELVFLKGETALKGSHDELWKGGDEIAKCIEVAVTKLAESQSR